MNPERNREHLVYLSSLGKGNVGQSLGKVQEKLKTAARALISGNSRRVPSLVPLLKSSYRGPKQSELVDSLRNIEQSMSKMQSNLDSASGYVRLLSKDAEYIDDQIQRIVFEWHRFSGNQKRQADIASKAAELHKNYLKKLKDTERLLKDLKTPNVRYAGKEIKGNKRLALPNYLQSSDVDKLHRHNMALLDAAISSEKDLKRRISLLNLRNQVEINKTSLPPLYILKFDPNEDGKIVVSKGNPYTAKNTQVFVPGMNTKLTGIEDNLNRVSLMNNAQAREGVSGNPNDHATVFFLDWDPPDLDLSGVALGSPSIPSKAFEESFVPFIRLIEKENQPSRITVVAHSFGTYAVSWAISRNDLPIDGLALMGSPGVPVEHATDLTKNMNNGAMVYSYTTKRDAVAIAVPYENILDGPIIGSLLGFPLGEAVSRLTRSGDPKASDFGATRMSSKNRANKYGHSDYWTIVTGYEDNYTLVGLGRLGAGMPMTQDSSE
jgi:hypothetical protein